jgi:hypothetical protein
VQRVPQIVRVVGLDGRPVAGVTLAVLSAAGPAPEMAYVTGGDGRVRIGLPPGTAELEAFAADGKHQRFSIDAAKEPGREHELHMGEDVA